MSHSTAHQFGRATFAAIVLFITLGCARPRPEPPERPAFVTCHGGCRANFDELARGERGVVVRSLDGRRTSRGELTLAGETRARELGRELAMLSLRDSYGCPGCADGPVLAVTLAGARHVFDPTHLDQVAGEAERSALSASALLFDDLRTPLLRCESNTWVRAVAPCEPFPTFGR